MSNQEIINILGGLLVAILGKVIHTFYELINDLQKSDKEITERLNKIEILVVGDYVRKDYLERKMDALFGKIESLRHEVSDKFDILRDKIDDKADR